MRRWAYSLPAKLTATILFAVLAVTTGILAVTAAGVLILRLEEIPVGFAYEDGLSYLMKLGLIERWTYESLTGPELWLGNYLFGLRHSSFLCIPAFIALVVVFVYLMAVAGRRPWCEEVRLSVFDRVPLDIVAALVSIGVIFLLVICDDLTGYGSESSVMEAVIIAGLALTALMLVLALLYTFSARVKAGKWWRNTVIYVCLALMLRFMGRMMRALISFLRAVRFEWRATALSPLFLAWDYLAIMHWVNGDEGMGFFTLAGFSITFLALTVMCVYEAHILLAAGRALASGDVNYKVDTSKLFYDFRRHGENLNSIGEGISAAVEERMRSERLKTELITNVSHDIKTPLTSIVNYVDLLQKPHTPEEQAEYLAVLARQSERLRRLTVDLVEASKASTGNLPVELMPTNTTELVNQAVAEYAERFEAGRLETVVTGPEVPVSVMADGRHLWRVLDNLFNNAIKYAQPGTRVYIDVLSVKNISRDRLNVSEDELMERFVRGDSSRHTEGSGLGLSIARSLTELMGGKFNITIDGDLFKAEIRLRLSKEQHRE